MVTASVSIFFNYYLYTLLVSYMNFRHFLVRVPWKDALRLGKKVMVLARILLIGWRYLFIFIYFQGSCGVGHSVELASETKQSWNGTAHQYTYNLANLLIFKLFYIYFLLRNIIRWPFAFSTSLSLRSTGMSSGSGPRWPVGWASRTGNGSQTSPNNFERISTSSRRPRM